MEIGEILTTDVRYYYTGEAQIHDTERKGQDMGWREGVWASLIKDTHYNNNVRDGKNTRNNSGTDNEVRGEKDTRNNNDVRDVNDTSNNDVRAPEWSSLREDVTMLSFNNCDIASKVCKFYKDLDYPSIPKVIAKVDNTTVVVEKIPQVPIMEWLKSGQEERMWTVDSNETQCLELEGRYSNIFRCIVATLSYLHSRDKWHGNLKGGIFVTGPTEEHPRVCIANFNVDIGFTGGFKNDLEDLKSLMKTAVEYSQSGLPKPLALDAFYHLFTEMNKIRDFATVRDFATFIYWAPVFYNWRDRSDFLNIVEKFSMQNSDMFRKKLIYDIPKKPCTCKKKGTWDPCLKHVIPSMNGWANKVPESATNPLRGVLEYSSQSKEQSGGSSQSKAQSGSSSQSKAQSSSSSQSKAQSSTNPLKGVLEYSSQSKAQSGGSSQSKAQSGSSSQSKAQSGGLPQSNSQYDNSGAIYQFHRNCLKHYKGTADKDFNQVAVENLLDVFPNALPAIFMALINKFYDQEGRTFRKSLTTFLKEAKKERGDNES